MPITFRDMRAGLDWAPNRTPENWEEAILMLQPIGNSFGNTLVGVEWEKVDDYRYHWWTQNFPSSGGKLQADPVATNADLSTPKAGSAASGETIYVAFDATDVDFPNPVRELKPGLLLQLGKLDNVKFQITVEIISVNEGNSSVECKTVYATPATAGLSLADADIAFAISDWNEQGAKMPAALVHDPSEFQNVTSIIRTPIIYSRTAMEQYLRTGMKGFERDKQVNLAVHGMKMDRAFLFSEKLITTGANGKPKTSMDGYISQIKKYAPGNVMNATDGIPANTLWTDYGDEVLDNFIEKMFRYNKWGTLRAVCGSGALLAIQRLAKAKGRYEMTQEKQGYGTQVIKLLSVNGTIELQQHMEFNRRPEYRNAICFYVPENIKIPYVTRTFFKDGLDPRYTTNDSRDGIAVEWIGEMGMKVYEYRAGGLLGGLGIDT